MYNGYRYSNADYMTVWRIKNHEELDLNPVDDFLEKSWANSGASVLYR